MNLIEACVRNPVKVSVGVILVALFGVIALFKMPIQLTPEVQIPTLTIETRWPGASPQEVEREIVQEQEEQLKSVEGVRKMSSESADSFGMIQLEFEAGTDMNEALVRVNSRLEQVREYPENADKPVISTSNSSDRPIARFTLRAKIPDAEAIAAFQAEHPDLAEVLEPVRTGGVPGVRAYRLAQLVRERPDLKESLQPILPPDLEVPTYRNFAEDVIEARLERIGGVSNVEVYGGREPELQVVVDPQRLAARQLTIADLRTVLVEQNRDISGGDFWEGKREYEVRTLGQFRSPEQVANLVLARRDGMPVYVRDVAEVRMGHKKPDGLVRSFGTSAIGIGCLRATGANVFDVMGAIKAEVAALNEGVLAQQGLQLDQVYDETEYIDSAMAMVNDNIYVGGLLTVLTLLLFLKSMRSTIVVAMVIPASIVGTFLMMYLMNRSLNVISLAGLAFAVGMLVDNGIVVLENIFARYQAGEDRMTATIRGAQEVWGAIVASSLTNLAIFLPVLFIEETAGQLFRDIALAISSAVGLSMLVCITVVPTATARILPARDAVPERHPVLDRIGPFLAPFDRFASWFVRMVMAINVWAKHNTRRSIATTVVLVLVPLGLSYMLLPKAEYLPAGNRNLVVGLLMPPPGYNIDQMTAMGEQIAERLKPYWDVDPESAEAAALDYPPIGDYFFVSRPRQVFLGLRAYDASRASELVPLVKQVTSDIPGTIGVANQTSLFGGGFVSGRVIDIEITGPELTKLVALGGQILGQVKQVIPEAQARPQPSLDLSSPEVHVVPKWEQAADMGITANELGYAVDTLVDGARATDYYVGGDKIDLTIMGQEDMAHRTQDLQALPIATRGGQLVPISAVANIILSSGPEQINHRERARSITIEVTPPPELALQAAVDIIREQIVEPLTSSGDLPPEYQITLAGTADKLSDTWRALRWNLLLAVVITYLLMAALFESWLYPLVIICSVPLGAVGGIVGLWMLNTFLLQPLGMYQPLDVLTMLGFVILVGTVVNNPILIVHQSLNYMREEGMTPRDAILESTRTRIRPIFMTAVGTVLGLLPLVLFPGPGSELYRGIGAVTLGGLIFSTIFTLVQVPVLFGLALATKSWLGRWWERWRMSKRDARHATVEAPEQLAPEELSSPEGSIAETIPEGNGHVAKNGADHSVTVSGDEASDDMLRTT